MGQIPKPNMSKRVGKCLQLVKSWVVGQGQTLEREEELALGFERKAAALMKGMPPHSEGMPTEASTARSYPLPACQAHCL